MTAHWIHIGGSPLAPTWELRHRVLGSYSVEDSPIDHQGARTLCMPLSHAEFPLSLQRFLIAALLCTYSRCQACRGTMPFVQFACGLPCYCHRLWGQRRQGFQHHPSMGLASLWMPSHTQCGERGAGELEEPCRQSRTSHCCNGTGGAGQVSVTVLSLHCCTNDLPIVPNEHVCNVLHS